MREKSTFFCGHDESMGRAWAFLGLLAMVLQVFFLTAHLVSGAHAALPSLLTDQSRANDSPIVQFFSVICTADGILRLPTSDGSVDPDPMDNTETCAVCTWAAADGISLHALDAPTQWLFIPVEPQYGIELVSLTHSHRSHRAGESRAPPVRL